MKTILERAKEAVIDPFDRDLLLMKPLMRFFGNCHVLSKTSGTGASNSSTMIMPLNGEAIWNANRAYTNGGLFTK